METAHLYDYLLRAKARNVALVLTFDDGDKYSLDSVDLCYSIDREGMRETEPLHVSFDACLSTSQKRLQALGMATSEPPACFGHPWNQLSRLLWNTELKTLPPFGMTTITTLCTTEIATPRKKMPDNKSLHSTVAASSVWENQSDGGAVLRYTGDSEWFLSALPSSTRATKSSSTLRANHAWIDRNCTNDHPVGVILQ